ncbi:MAG: 30S ribosomal protein S3 [bacterium]|jgi:small subunit ribosomal protein S3
MGQKTHPKCLRLQTVDSWDALWYAPKKNFGDNLVQDIKIRRYLEKELRNAQPSRIEIKRYPGRVIINVWVVRMGIAVGKGATRRDELKQALIDKLKIKDDIHLDFYEETHPDLNARVVMENVIQQLERRINFRRVLRQTLKRCEQAGAKGVKLMVAGRLNGAEMCRREWYLRGRIPLHTLRAKINYASGHAATIYGSIGVKVWVFTGEELPRPKPKPELSSIKAEVGK